LCGIAGQYFVAAELSRRGYIATITLRNTRGIDVLASNLNADGEVGIQVKTTRKDQPAWLMGQKAEGFHADNFFYVFVTLKSEYPKFYVVPSKVVASYVESSHMKWLDTPGRKGQRHKDSSMRMFRDTSCEYLGRWDLLNL
jgi:hypothetical protein